MFFWSAVHFNLPSVPLAMGCCHWVYSQTPFSKSLCCQIIGAARGTETWFPASCAWRRSFPWPSTPGPLDGVDAHGLRRAYRWARFRKALVVDQRGQPGCDLHPSPRMADWYGAWVVRGTMLAPRLGSSAGQLCPWPAFGIAGVPQRTFRTWSRLGWWEPSRSRRARWTLPPGV